MKLVKRTHCPVCHSTGYGVINQKSCASPELQDYLHAFYSPAGYPEPEKLKGYDFTLAECADCRLIFQL